MSTRKEFIAAALADVQTRIANAAQESKRSLDEITLIAVTKTYPASDVAILHELGQRNFGENRTEEGSEKSLAISGTWHYQGQVQSRKLREIASWADLIHSLDEVSHIEKLARICEETGKRIGVFLQLSLDGAPDRGGVVEENLATLAESVTSSKSLELKGLMCVPPVEYDHDRAFSEIAQIHQRFIKNVPAATALSAGMSSDFEVAIAYGATHLRVGSQILGSRTYHP
jgi:pyridoxal phosphate enzyme (YggS family)